MKKCGRRDLVSYVNRVYGTEITFLTFLIAKLIHSSKRCFSELSLRFILQNATYALVKGKFKIVDLGNDF